MGRFKLLKQLIFYRYPFWEEIRDCRKDYILGLTTLFVVDLINVVLPLVLKVAIDALLPPFRLQLVFWMAFLFFALMALQSVGRYLWRYYLMGSSHRVARNLRLQFYDHLQRLPYPFYQRVQTGDLMSRATNDIESIRMAVGPGILVMVDAIFMFALILPAMIYLSPKLTLLTFAFYPIIPWLTAHLGQKIDDLFEKLQVQMSMLSAATQESFSSIRLIKSLTLEPTVSRRFSHLSQKYRELGIESAKYQALFSPSLSVITSLGTFLILLIGGLDVISGVITVGTFVAFQRFVVQLSWPMEAIGWSVTLSKEGTSAKRRLKEILEAPRAIISHPSSHRHSTKSLLDISGLKFSYPRAFRLDMSDLAIDPGKKIGIVGPVGSGKTTLLQLILRLVEPPPETIFLEGRDILSIPLFELRRRVVTVEQQVFLFSESIRSNLTMGLSRAVTPSEIKKVTEWTCLTREIDELSMGFDTPLGERGVNLSGGQKQRLALSRALVRRPELLLLDDCFSAVDVLVEKSIMRQLLENSKMSILLATHRLAAMPEMDEIWVVEAGRILARAHHDELVKNNWLYRELWEKSSKKIAELRVEKEWGELRSE